MFQVDQLNQQALSLCKSASEKASLLDMRVVTTKGGATVLDFGVDRIGTLAGGVELSHICLSNMAQVAIVPSRLSELPLPFVQVVTDFPVEACMASQYAGWPFSTEQFFSMCSGPARLKRGREELLEQYQLKSDDSEVVGIFEARQIPAENDLREFAEQCNCELSGVTVCIARTSSLPGSMQVVSRSVETAMHKLFELDFDLSKVKRAIGFAPLPPAGNDDYQSMGWTNDAILFGGEVVLWIDNIEQPEILVEKLPSCASPEFGRPFIEIFEECDRDFYNVDRLLFSPARVTLVCTTTGDTVSAGEIRTDLLHASFNKRRK